MKLTFKWKLIVGLVALEVIALTLIASINLAITNPLFEEIAQQRLQQLNSCLSNKFELNRSNLKVEEITSLMHECYNDDSLGYFVLFDQKGRMVRKNGWPGAPLTDEATLDTVMGNTNTISWETPSFYNSIRISLPASSIQNGYLVYGATTRYKTHAQYEFVKKQALLSAVIVLLSIVGFVLLKRWLHRNLKKIETAANEILQGRYDVTVEPLESQQIARGGFTFSVVSTALKHEIQELKASERKQRRIAERMLKVANAVPDFMLLGRISDGHIVYANPGVGTLTGYDHTKLAGRSMDKVEIGITTDQRREWRDKLISTGSVANYETAIKHKNGSLVNVLISTSLLEIDDTAHALIICHDITDRKLIEAAVAYANRQLNYVLEAASEIAIISTDMNGVVQMFNRGAEKMLGYRAREKIGMPLHFGIHDKNELAQRSKELSRQLNTDVLTSEVLTIIPAKQGSETRNWTYICKNEHRLNVSLTVTRVQDSSGKIIGFLGIARDITLQLQAEQALQDLNHQLEKRVEERTAELDDTNKNLANAMHNLQLAQDELVRTEKLTALGDIVAVVAHEINTPIGNCLTVATTLRDRSTELYAEVEQGTIRRSSLSSYMNDSKEGLDILIRGLHRSSELVSNFKQVAVDQTSEQRRVFKLHQIVNEVVALMMPKLRKTPHQLEISIPDEITMDSFPGPLEQVVSNLINNSILHAFDADKKGTMKLVASLDAQNVRITFSDDGKGIPEQYLNRIFDPFFTTKLGRGGTGLGLNIVHNIVKNMLGGQIDVRTKGITEAGTGTTFVMVLPLSAPQSVPAEKRPRMNIL
jgi:PAS domain S-box-containing protein